MVIVQVGKGTCLLSTVLDLVWGLHYPNQVGPHVANLFPMLANLRGAFILKLCAQESEKWLSGSEHWLLFY